MATNSKSKEEQIFIGVNDEVIELTGKEKEVFLDQRAKDQAEFDARKKAEDDLIALRKSAYIKLGLTEEEVNAVI